MRQGALAVIPAQATGMAFNCDSSLLAVWCDTAVYVYPVKGLVDSGTAEVLQTWTISTSSPVAQVSLKLHVANSCASPSQPCTLKVSLFLL